MTQALIMGPAEFVSLPTSTLDMPPPTPSPVVPALLGPGPHYLKY